MKRYISELLGTMVLVLFGCGSAAIAGSILGTFGIAMAFLAMVNFAGLLTAEVLCSSSASQAFT